MSGLHTQNETLGFRAAPRFGADRRRPWLRLAIDRALWCAIGAIVARLIAG